MGLHFGFENKIFDNEAKDLEREVCFIDIACDEIPERYYKESEQNIHKTKPFNILASLKQQQPPLASCFTRPLHSMAPRLHAP
ncbi:hypothetical protein MC885_021022 [Smutsia gigantea]|nr:hypothetical protein MC885_021022 [Smutsia gigantea]